MEVMQVLHMNKGDGDASYAKNSTVQRKIMFTTKPVIEEAIMKLLRTNIPESIGIADLGCSTGPNTLLLISEIVDIIYAKCCQMGHSPPPELRVSLNDLPGNDFNNIFMSVPAFYNKLREEKGTGVGPCFISGVPGSFYGRLFPSSSMHFIHSSSSLHWLSRAPSGLESNASTSLNKGKIYISKSSPQCVLDAYLLQFQNDFSLFLKSRSEEIVPGGRMVLSLCSGVSTDPPTEENGCYQWELMATALMGLVSEGLIEEEKVDSFNVPFYMPCLEEVKLEIQKEGSFIIDRIESSDIDWVGSVEYMDPTSATQTKGQREAKKVRAATEPMLELHFGSNIMDNLFRRYEELAEDYLSNCGAKYTNLVISTIRKG
ncbi:Methyltransf_7 domain-containing protein [Cephalotus follicularis]|uniref:Methyltransf_7 domain-containing protein n=1 Tax=Cephalotus follicularis TaxID=3775 RepID=A0A1Q3CT07_CEPFO|nr:Methyltransf_7 domain-containing protein [Cephalotus follicularis]